MQEEAARQFYNLRPPRRGQCLAVTVDVTARPYDLGAILLAACPLRPGADGANDTIDLTIQNDGANTLYFVTSPATANDLALTADAVGTAPLTLAVAHGAVLPAGQSTRLRFNRQADRWIQLLAGAATTVCRIYPSSQHTAQPPQQAGT